MPDEIKTITGNKSDIKHSSKTNVIPITSISDLGNIVGEIQNQLAFLISRLDNDVSPEFKALMEGYVNKANESEEFKVNLENITASYQELKAEIGKVRETNRNLIHELQIARELLKKLEDELSSFQESSTKAEEEYKEKIKMLTNHNTELQNKIQIIEKEKEKAEQELELKTSDLKQNQEKLRQELLDQNYASHQKEQELTIQRDNLLKQVEEFEILLKEQKEKLELKSKEVEYKDALLNQLVKKATTEKLKVQELDSLTVKQNTEKKRKGWFF